MFFLKDKGLEWMIKKKLVKIVNVEKEDIFQELMV
jgi:hypothetical protein